MGSGDDDSALAMGLRASLLLNDDDYEEHALDVAALDRLMDGECIVDQLDYPHKKRKVSTGSALDGGDNGDGDDDGKCGRDNEELDAEPECEMDDALRAEEDAFGYADEGDDDDGADALIAELGDGTWHVDDDESDQVAKALLAVNSQEKRLLRADSCCSMFSMSGREVVEEQDATTSDSKATTSTCKCSRLTDDEPFLQNNASKEYLDLHIRYQIHVRVVEVDIVDNHTRFILRVEDAETKRKWEIKKSSSEMIEFYRQIKKIGAENAPVKKDLWGTFRSLRKFHLPKKMFHFRGALLHQRKVVFDSFLRQTAALVSPAPLGPRRRRAVLLLQEFCGVHRHCEVYDRSVCNCFHFKNQVNATQLITEIFASAGHAVFKECEAFVAALTRSSHETRRSKLTPRKARAILKAISRKMTELKKMMFEDEILRRELRATRSEHSEEDHEEFVEEIRHAVCAYVEKHVMVPLEDHVYESLHTIYSDEDELRLKNKLRVMQTKDQSYFGIPQHMISPNDWEDARRELRRIDEYSLPLDKLKCIVRSASAVFRSCIMDAGSSSLTSVEQFGPSITTDEFIAINLFVVVTSNMPKLLVTKELLQLMCDYHDATGEIGYYLTNFEAAIDLIERHHNPMRPMFDS
uniref:VPS9 domain-containing protein n=1 Tax=Globisporangium ultimum (strain ATCC 200006 / CBS 805.95 / DAOM BR144) TaxID=431595 RepID=K3XCG4_GLOUD